MLHQVLNRPWAVTPEVAFHVRGLFLDRDFARLRHLAELRLAAREEAAPARARLGQGRGGGVAVVQVVGLMTLRGERINSADTVSTLGLADQVDALAADSSVEAIVLELDTPGGQVAGVPEAAARIREARSAKPVVAVANSSAGSAGYWLFAQADEGIVTLSGHVGSIGVYALHEDESKALEAAGVKVSLVSAGKYKVEGNPFEPLGDEARAAWQGDVDQFYGLFTSDVARGRRVSVEAVRKGFGEGRMVGARAAVEQGMADMVGTLDDAIRRASSLASERRRGAKSVAQAQMDQYRRERG